MSIWYHLGKRQNDVGQIWLALSILCWSFSGLVDVINAKEASDQFQFFLEGSKSVLSLLNSFFILLALPWFRYLPLRLEGIIKSRYWKIIIGVPLIFALLPTISKLMQTSEPKFIAETDVYYSILTLIILGWVLWESFSKRRLHMLAYLSILCIGITFVAQIYKLGSEETHQILLSAIFKTCLIMIFFALALSWVKDMSEALGIHNNITGLKLTRKKDESGKLINVVELVGLFDNEIKLSNTHFSLVDKFARAKLQGDGWLEIKPKNDTRTGKMYDINHYNEIKRAMHSMLDNEYGKGNWSKDLHELPLKEMLFERSQARERKIRLAIEKEKIHLS